MTATCAGSGGGSSCLTAKGLDISLAALKRQDPYINNIVDVASQVALYTYNNRANEWEKTEVEGTLFIYTRLASPRHGFTIMNRLSMENLTEPITKDLDFQLQDPFLLYRNARLVIHGIWFYDKGDCQRIAQRMKILTHQEQALAQAQSGWPSPGGGGQGGGGGGEGKAVDIIQMLSKARSEYNKEKSSSEPKEIGGSSVLHGNPNLVKPIPVKPATQDSEAAEPKPLSLAALFGSQPQHQQSPVSPLDASGTGSQAVSNSNMGKVSRPPVARTLTYDDSASSAGSVASTGAHSAVTGQTVGEPGGVVAGVPASTTATNQQEHCPAIQKLMQGQRGVGGVLQTVSESPENRLCDNGVPLEHHHHHHHHHQQLYHHLHQQHHLHHHYQQQQQQQQECQVDPIRRLFQSQQPPPFSTAPACCSNSAPLFLSSQPLMMDSGSRPQHGQPLFYSLPKSQTQHQHDRQPAPTTQGAGLLLSQVSNDQGLQSSQGLSSQMPGVVSPHELLQKLQLVQQEQHQASHDSLSLAPQFQGAAPPQGASSVLGSVPNQIAGQKIALQYQVISPQRIPATVAPALLLSPSAFSQARSAVPQDGCPAPSAPTNPPLQAQLRVLSRSQFQATLLHLIETDSSFLDAIYEAYVRRFSKESSSK